MIPTSEAITISISSEQIIAVVKQMEQEQREAFIEDLLAAVSPAYLTSIREAREDYQAGRVYSHEEVFD
jgi:hypothetical protein